jgi:hypothetical protein
MHHAPFIDAEDKRTGFKSRDRVTVTDDPRTFVTLPKKLIDCRPKSGTPTM